MYDYDFTYLVSDETKVLVYFYITRDTEFNCFSPMIFSFRMNDFRIRFWQRYFRYI